MGTVNIAELKDRLSLYLHRVRRGEEFIIRDRNLPVAKIVPLRGDETDAEERSLVASGQMALPNRALDQKTFWAIGGRVRGSPKIADAIKRAIAAEREDYVGVLGHKRDHPHMRTRSKRKDG